MLEKYLNNCDQIPGGGMTPSAKKYIGAVKAAIAENPTPLAEVPN